MINGLAGSPGVVEGIARVVLHRSTSSTRSEEGDILVCQMTNPAWVVLFTKIAGLVTDAGGPRRTRPCSPASSASRRSSAPPSATQRIKTGDRIRVNGIDRRGRDPAREADRRATAPTPAAIGVD